MIQKPDGPSNISRLPCHPFSANMAARTPASAGKAVISFVEERGLSLQFHFLAAGRVENVAASPKAFLNCSSESFINLDATIAEPKLWCTATPQTCLCLFGVGCIA